jgi:hypothetical protein
MPRLGIPGGKQLHPVELHGVLDLHLFHIVENTDKEKKYKAEEANIFGSRTHICRG